MIYSLGKTLLNIENVSLAYDGKLILSEVNAQVQDVIIPDVVKGQIIGILGPSGCGKTTLFRIIAGLLKPTSGRVVLDSLDRPVLPGEVGLVAQDYPLFAHRTILGNLMLGAIKKEKNPKIAKDKVMAMLAEFGL